MSISARRRIWREKLDEGLDLADVEILSHDFNIDFDNLEGNIKKTKIASLLEALEERKLLGQLQAYFAESDEYSHIELPGTSATLPESPYRGLFTFQEIHADNFFGRDLFIDQVIRALGSQPLVPVVGPSGSGKSSLIFAGVVPRIRHNPDWLITYFRPGNEPLGNLVGELVALLEPEMSTVDRRIEINKVEEGLRNGLLTLVDVVKDILAKDRGVSNLLLYVDQFEELFTHNPEKEEQALFLTKLLSLLPTEENDTKVKILYTMRADFLGDALSHNILADVLNAEEIDDIKLRPMNRREMAQVIMNPALNAGTTFEEGLVDRILDDVGNQPGNLPLLQFVLDEMWTMQESYAMTHTSYQLLGEVTGALALYADSVYESLTASEKRLAPRIFTQMVQPGRGSSDTRRLVLKDELDESMWPLIVKLTDARLLVTSRDGLGNETIELSHEALIGTWSILTQWMSTDRTFREWQEQMRANMRQWEHGGRDVDLLLRGAALEEAREWLGKRSEDMTARDIEYIKAGEAEALQAERLYRLRLVASFLAAGIIGILGLISLSLQGSLRAREADAVREANAAATSEVIAQSAATRAIESANTAEAEREIAAQALQTVESAVATTDLALSFSEEREQEAVAARQTSEADQAFAIEARLTADASALDAESARATAIADRDAANQAKLEAEAAREEADAAREESEVQKKIAESQAFAAESRIELGIDPMRSLLLAVEAGRAGDSVQAFNALNLTLPLISQPADVTIDPFLLQSRPVWLSGADDDAFLLKDDGVLTIWDRETGDPLRNFSVNLDGDSLTQFSEVVLSPNKTLLFGSYERLFSETRLNAAIVWDVASGDDLFVFENINRIEAGVWDDASQQILFWDSQGSLWVFDGRNGNNLVATEDANIRGAAWAPDGDRFVTWHPAGLAIVWDVATAEPVNRVQLTNRDLVKANFSPDGTNLLLQTSTGIVIVDAALGEDADATEVNLDTLLSGFAWSPDSSRLTIWGADNLIRVWDTDTESVAFVLAHFDTVAGVRWSRNGNQILSWSNDNTARVWNAETGLQLELFEHFDQLRGATWNRDESEILTWSVDGTARIWDPTTGDPLLVFTHDSPLLSADYSPSENGILTRTDNGNVQVFENRQTYPALDQPIAGRMIGARWNNGDDQIIGWGQDGNLRLVDVTTGEIVRTINHHPTLNEDVRGAVWGSDDRQLLSWGDDDTVNVWDLDTTAPPQTLALPGPPDGAQWNRDETLVLVWGNDSILIWDPVSGDVLTEWNHPRGTGATWNRDESQVLSWGGDGHLFVWSVDQQDPILTIEVGGPIQGAMWDQDEGQILSWGNRLLKGVSFWDAETGQINFILPHDDTVTGVLLSNDGERLISWGVDDKVRIWDIRDGENGEVLTQLEHDRDVIGVELTASEERVLSWSLDKTARLWDSQTGRLLSSVSGGDDWIRTAALNSAEDQLLITTRFGSIFKIFNTEVDDLVDLGCDVATRNFTWDEWRRYRTGEPYAKTCRDIPVHCSVPDVSWPQDLTPELRLCPNR